MRLKHLALISAALTMPATATLGLSCVRPDVARTFQAASASEDGYVVLLGKFAPDGLPEKPDAATAKQTSGVAEFTGRLLTQSGFVEEVTVPIEVTLGCAGIWCAEIKPDAEYLAFVLQTEDKLMFQLDACAFNDFYKPSEDDIARVVTCAKGGACEPAQ